MIIGAAQARPSTWWGRLAFRAALAGIVLVLAVFVGPSIALGTGAPPDRAAAASAAQSQADLCAIFPPGFTEPDREVDIFQAAAGIVASCSVQYPIPMWGWIMQFRDAATAQQRFAEERASNSGSPVAGLGDEATLFSANLSGQQRYTLYVRRDCYIVQGHAGSIMSPFTPSLSAQQIAAIRDTIAQVDRGLMGRPCAGSVPASTSTVGLACDPQDLQTEGLVTCVAAVANAQPNADLVYEWTVNGQIYTGETGEELTLTDLAPGTHTVSVLVRDVANGTSVGPESVSFTRAPAATTGSAGTSGTGSGIGAGAGAGAGTGIGVTPSSGLPPLGSSAGPASTSTSTSAPPPETNVWPVVAGSAVAVATAVGMLTFGRIRRRRPPDPPAEPPMVRAGGPPPPGRPASPTRPAPPAPPSRPVRPAAPPERVTNRMPPPPRPAGPITLDGPPDTQMPLAQALTGQVLANAPPYRPPRPPEREDRLGPQLFAMLYLTASPRPNSTSATGDLQLWGDGVDLVWADYDLAVTPGWEIVGEPTHVALVPDASVASSLRVTPFADFETQLKARVKARYPNLILPTVPTHHFAVQAENWGKSTFPAALRLEVTATVRHVFTQEEHSLSAREPESRLSATVQVVAANPQLYLEAETTGANGTRVRDSVNPASKLAGLQGYADGVCVIWLTPRLLLFDAAYAGGLAIADIPAQIKIAGLTTQVPLDTYFEAKREDLVLRPPGPAGAAGPFPLDPHPGRRVQRLRLRGRFHLNDQAIKDLGDKPLLVHCGARPTGEGPSQDVLYEWFDYMARERYERVASRVGARTAEEPIEIGLLPSTIDIRPTPDLLPTNRDFDYTHPAYYSGKSVIKATVRSAHPDGHLVPGPSIDTDRGQSYARSWQLTFSLEPPRELHCPRLFGTCNCTRATTAIDLMTPLTVNEVNGAGMIVCSDATGTYEEFEYDHLTHFNRNTHRGYWGNGAHLTVAVQTPDGTFPEAPATPASGAAPAKRPNQIRIEVEPPADLAIWAFGRGTQAEPTGPLGQRGKVLKVLLEANGRYKWFEKASTHEDYDLFRCERDLAHEFRHYDFAARRSTEPPDDTTGEEGYYRIRCTATGDFVCHDFAWRASGRTTPTSLVTRTRINPDVVIDLAAYGLSDYAPLWTGQSLQPGDVVAYLNAKQPDGTRQVAGHSALVLWRDSNGRVRLESKDNSGSRFRHWLGTDGQTNYLFEDYAGSSTSRLRYYRRGQTGYLLRPDDFANLAGMIVNLRDGTDPLSIYLRNQLTDATRAVLNRWNGTADGAEPLRGLLAHELNRVLEKPLYDTARFQQVTPWITPDVQALIAQNPQGAELIRLNRRLLETAYPNGIAKAP